MYSRRAMLASLIAAGGLGWQQPNLGTPVATPRATRIEISGEGTLREQNGTPTFEFELTAYPDRVEGGFRLAVFPVVGVEWVIEPTEILYVKPLSDASPHIKRISGYATVNGENEQPFLLDLIDAKDDAPQELNFVLGAEAAPFLGEDVKLGCDCGPLGIGVRSVVETGGFTITES